MSSEIGADIAILVGKPPAWIDLWYRLRGIQVIRQNPLDESLAQALAGGSLRISNEVRQDLTRVVERWKHSVARTKSSFIYSSEMDRKEIEAVILQRVHARHGFEVRFASLVKKVLGSGRRVRVVMSAPRPVRAGLQAIGLEVDSVTSEILWQLQRARLLSGFVVATVAEALRLGKNWWVIRKQASQSTSSTLPDCFFLDVAPSQINLGDQEKLNVVDFIQKKTFAPFADANKVFVQVSRPTVHVDGTPPVEIGRNLFACGGQKRRPLATLFREWTALALNFPLVFFRSLLGGWQELLIAQDTVALPRIRTWFDVVRPKHIVFSVTSCEDPLWSLLRKKSGCLTWILFYSTNWPPLQLQGEALEIYPFECTNTRVDRIAVWDEDQKAQFVRLGHSPERIEIVGPVIYGRYPKARSVSEILKESRPKIAVFDVVPLNLHTLIALGFGPNYYQPDLMIQLMKDSLEVAREIYGRGGFELLIKPKRAKSTHSDDRYWAFIEEFSKEPEVVAHPSELNPMLVVAESTRVISVPYSSTAILGRYFQRPSCYYDPFGRIYDHMIEKNIPAIIRGRDELKAWFAKG